MARKAGQLISRGTRTWLVRIPLGRDPESGTRKYHNMTVHGGLREAQSYLNRQAAGAGHRPITARTLARSSPLKAFVA